MIRVSLWFVQTPRKRMLRGASLTGGSEWATQKLTDGDVVEHGMFVTADELRALVKDAYWKGVKKEGEPEVE